MLGPAGLLDLVRATLDRSKPESLIPDLLRAIDGRAGTGLRADDATVLLLRANGTGATVPWRRSLLAPFRVLASVGRAVAGRGPMSLPDLNLANLGGAVIPALNRRWKGT